MKNNNSVNSNSPTVPIISFTSQLTCLKNSLGLWEDIVAKSNKLSAALRTVVLCIASFLEALQKIADVAYNSNCGLRELGSSMTRFCLRERAMEVRLKNFNSQLTDCLAAPLALRLEEWRRTVAQLDRENNKEWRRARNELLRATSEMEKLQKRFRRKAGNTSGLSKGVGDLDSLSGKSGTTDVSSGQTGDNLQLNFVQQDLNLKRHTLAELERLSLRKAVVEERRRFAELMTCLKPVLDSQTSLFSDVAQLEESVSSVVRNTVLDPNDLPSDTEQAIDVAVDHQLASITSMASSSSGETRLLAAGVRSMRLLKNYSSSRVDLSASNHHNSASTSSLLAGGEHGTVASRHPSQLSLTSAGPPVWGVMAANAAALAGVPRQSAGVTAKSVGRRSSRSPSLSPMVNRCNELLPSSPTASSRTSPSHQSHHSGGQAGSKTHGDAISLFEHQSDSLAMRPLEQPVGYSSGDSAVTIREVEMASVVNGFRDAPPHHCDVIVPPPAYVSSGRIDSPARLVGITESRDPNSHPSNQLPTNGEDETGQATTDDYSDDNDETEGDDDDHLVQDSGSTDDQLSQEHLDSRDDGLGRIDGGSRLPQKSFLYPNQVLPSPVYTNLSELKRAAARKLGGSQADVSRPVYPSSQMELGNFGAGHLRGGDTTSLHGCLLARADNDSNLQDTGQQAARDDYFALVGSNSGTSTFGRRQSEYARIAIAGGLANPSRCSDAIDLAGVDYQTGKIYASATPGLVRRSSNQPGLTGNPSGPRPVHPPRRSSSVCRDPTEYRQPPSAAAPVNNMFLPVSHGPVLAADYNLMAKNYPWLVTEAPVPLFPGGPVFSMPTYCQSSGIGGDMRTSPYLSTIAQGHYLAAQRNDASDATASLAYTLPPLAAAGSGVIGRQNGPMMFGVKVLPNHQAVVGANGQSVPAATTTAVTTNNNVSRLPRGSGGLPRQMSCGPPKVNQSGKFGYHGDGTSVSRANGGNTYQQRKSRAQSGAMNREGRVSSFID